MPCGKTLHGLIPHGRASSSAHRDGTVMKPIWSNLNWIVSSIWTSDLIWWIFVNVCKLTPHFLRHAQFGGSALFELNFWRITNNSVSVALGKHATNELRLNITSVLIFQPVPDPDTLEIKSYWRLYSSRTLDVSMDPAFQQKTTCSPGTSGPLSLYQRPWSTLKAPILFYFLDILYFVGKKLVVWICCHHLSTFVVWCLLFCIQSFWGQ